MNTAADAGKRPVRVLAIHAHPDDCEILAGGTLALLAGAGVPITIVTMTAGDCGSDVLPPAAISARRKQEALKAASLVGADYDCLEFKDLAIFTDDDGRRRVTAALRRRRPDIVLTSSPVDYHCDHEATSALVLTACFAASAPNYAAPGDGGAAPLPSIPHLYYMDPINGVDKNGHAVTPDFTVDVEPAMETKKQLLACHASQREWLRRMHGIDDYIEQMVSWTAKCGSGAWMHYGEGFRQYKGHPYPQSPLLEELLDGLARVQRHG